MKCQLCDGKGEYMHAIGGYRPCDVCDGTGEITVTNDEWRKHCSAEEFAEWISNLAYTCMRCGMNNGKAYCHTGYCIQDKEDAKKWLREKHEE